MWLGVSAGGQMKSHYISPKGKEGTSPQQGSLLMSVYNFYF